jgi:hypothetical protein
MQEVYTGFLHMTGSCQQIGRWVQEKGREEKGLGFRVPSVILISPS